MHPAFGSGQGLLAQLEVVVDHERSDKGLKSPLPKAVGKVF